MKRLNFSKMLKSIGQKIKQLAKWSKNIFSKEKKKESGKWAPSGNYRNRKGGYKKYRYVLKPVSGFGAIIYRDFNKAKLPGSKMFSGKTLYSIEKNPHYSFN